MTDSRFRNPSFACPHCGTLAQHGWFGVYADDETNEGLVRVAEPRQRRDPAEAAQRAASGDWNVFEEFGSVDWWASRCTVSTCRRYCFWRDAALVYPSRDVSELPKPNSSMPEGVRALYSEATEVFAVSRRAGAALARATLEALLREVDPDAGKANLDERMARMEGRLSTTLWDTLDLVRHVGNKALHVSGVPDEAVVLVLDEEDTEVGPALFEIINDVVDETIVKEQKRARLADLIPQSVRDGVDRTRARTRDTHSSTDRS